MPKMGRKEKMQQQVQLCQEQRGRLLQLPKKPLQMVPPTRPKKMSLLPMPSLSQNQSQHQLPNPSHLSLSTVVQLYILLYHLYQGFILLFGVSPVVDHIMTRYGGSSGFILFFGHIYIIWTEI
jgi:hypothetical protein